jgi:FemAB family protein
MVGTVSVDSRSVFTANLVSLLANAGLKGISRVAEPSLWTQTALRLSYLPVTYLSNVIDYQLAYWSGNGVPIEDLSLVLFHDNRPCGLWPLSISTYPNGLRIGSSGGDVEPPLFVADLAARSSKSQSAKCLEVLAQFAAELTISSWESAASFTGDTRLGEWHDRAMRSGASCTLKHEMYVDLSPELAHIKSTFRKSYKALVTSGSQLWQVCVLDGEGDGIWEEYRLLHLAVAGRTTRSLESWNCQYRAICDGQAFLVYLRDEAGRMVGGGLFHTTKDEALYAVGAYDRDLFDKPLGHVVQYRAIEEMKKRGVRWYKLGARPYPNDHPAPSEKELAIADFKQGFSSHLFPRYVIHHRLPGAAQSSPISGQIPVFSNNVN